METDAELGKAIAFWLSWFLLVVCLITAATYQPTDSNHNRNHRR